jgi:hypothetical protein
VAQRLRELRYDAVALAERPEVADRDDVGISAFLREEGRALVTQNVADWLPLADRVPGLILVDRQRYPRTPLAVDRLLLSLDATLGGLAGLDAVPEGARWLEPPAGCAFWRGAG